MSTALVRQSTRSLVSRRGFLQRAALAVVGVAATRLLPAVGQAAEMFGVDFDWSRPHEFVTRLDVIWGWRVVKPEMACRVIDDGYDDPRVIDVPVLRSELVELEPRTDPGIAMRVIRQWVRS